VGDNIQETGNLLPPVTETPAPPKRVWDFWPTFGFSLAILAVYAIVQIWSGVIYFLFKLASAREGLLEEAISQLGSDGLLISIATVTSAIAGLGFIILFVKLRKGPSLPGYLGLRRLSRKSFIVLLVLALVFIAFFLATNQFQESQDSDFAVKAYETSVWPALYGIAVVIFAPAFEESFFRGFLFVGLKQSRLGSIGTIILTALGWALLHLQYDIYGIAVIFSLGICFGIVRLKTGSLWSTLFLHALWNLMAVIASASYVNNLG
jgi:uncharacterized protein